MSNEQLIIWLFKNISSSISNITPKALFPILGHFGCCYKWIMEIEQVTETLPILVIYDMSWEQQLLEHFFIKTVNTQNYAFKLVTMWVTKLLILKRCLDWAWLAVQSKTFKYIQNSLYWNAETFFFKCLTLGEE